MKTIKDENFVGGPFTLNQICDGEARQVAALQCDDICFLSNSFYRVFEMWADLPKPRPKVKAIRTIG